MIGLVEQVPLGSLWFPKEGAKGVSQRIQVIGYVDETYADPILEVVRTRGTGTRDKGQLRVSGLLAKYERGATR